MYICRTGDGYKLSSGGAGAVVDIGAPIIEEEGCEIPFVGISWDDRNGKAGYSVDSLFASDSYEDLGNGFFSVERKIKNCGQTKRTFKTIFEVTPLFDVKKYLIPCVSYNGNEWGEGKEPKGLLCDGTPWVHGYDRTGIPSCSITENKRDCLALFASDRDAASLHSSVSIKPDGGKLRQRIIHPYNETPYTYSDNDKYTEKHEEFITLAGGESFTVLVYILAGVPKWENYGVCTVLDRLFEVFPFDMKPNLPPEEIARLGSLYNKKLLRPDKKTGDLLFASGMAYNAKINDFIYSSHSEVGWCGQNIMASRFLILEYRKTGDEKLLSQALEVLDNWVKKQCDNGLLLAHYEWYTEGRNWNPPVRDYTKSWASNVNYASGWNPDVCNLGWAAAEMIKVWALLSSMGLERPEYRAFALKICDFFVANYSDEFAFGKNWRFDGSCEEKFGSIGGFMTMALIEVYKITKTRAYLDTAVESIDFYFRRDLDEFVCTAGAIDCTCVDKETAGPFLIAALDLYEITNDKKYITYAEKAAYYFSSWIFYYDVIYSDEAEFSQYGYHTKGGTSVSVQHPAIDQWGELLVPEFIRLFRITGERKWKTRALMMWYNSTQFITSETSEFRIHGHERPLGSQNEAFYHCRWGHRPNPDERGHFNDWLVAWVNMFRMTALERMKSVLGDKDFSELEPD